MRSKKNLIFFLFTGILFFLDLPIEGKNLVYIGRNEKLVNSFQRNFRENFDIKIHCYILSKKDTQEKRKSLINSLLKSKLLLIGKYASGSARFLFMEEDYKKALNKFLENGGTIFFDYYGLSPISKKYLESIGVAFPDKVPQEKGKNYWSGIIPENLNHPVISTPNRITRGQTSIRGYNWWIKPSSKKQIVILIPNIDKEGAGLILQENVLGKGKIFFSQAYSIGPTKDQTTESRKLLENILSYIYGEKINFKNKKDIEPEGVIHPAWDNYEKKNTNLLYGSHLSEQPWWDKKWEYRIPVIVHEPIGKRRYNIVLSLSYSFPEKISPSSIRVVSATGEELISQIYQSNGKTEILFFLDELLPHQNLPLYIYFSEKKMDLPDYPTDLKRISVVNRLQGKNYLLENNKLKIEIGKDTGLLYVLKIKAGTEKNQVPQYGKYMGQSPCGFGFGGESRIIEEGPLRVTIEYKKENDIFQCSLLSKSNLIHFRGFRIGGRCRRWRPGGDGINDSFFYETDKGIKEIKLTLKHYLPYKPNFIKFMKEGWYGVCDIRKKECVGEFFDLENVPSLKVAEHFTGNRWYILYKKAEEWVEGALIGIKGDWKDVRGCYINWKNPPEIYTGKIEKIKDIPVKVPEWGKDSIRIIPYSYVWYEAVRNTGSPEEVAKSIVSEVIRWGGNYINISGGSTNPIWRSKWRKDTRYHKKDWIILDPLIEEAHKRGVGVRLALHGYPGFVTPEGEKMCIIKHYNLHMEAYKEISSYDIDCFSPICEPPPRINSKEAENRFRRKYKIEFKNLSRDQLNALFTEQARKELLFRMESLNEYIKGMVGIFRKKNPKTILTVCASPNNLGKFDSFYDFETLYKYLDSPSMDLYGTQTDFLRYWITYLRGLSGNGLYPRKTIHCWTGCTNEVKKARVNSMLHLLYGNPYPMFFGAFGSNMLKHPEVGEEVKNIYEFLKYTGLGKLLVECPPLKFIGVYRDRNGFIDSIKKGESVRGTGGTTKYTRMVGKRVLIPNIPTDIIVSHFLKTSYLNLYKVVIVPSDPVLSDRDAKEFLKYAFQGGILILEGETIRNKAISKKLNVSVKKDLEKGNWIIDFGKESYKYSGRKFSIELKDKDTQIIGTIDKEPVIITRKEGEGRIIYICCEHVSNEIIIKLLSTYIELPLKIKPPYGNYIESNIFTDGERFILGLYNRTSETLKFPVYLNLPFEKNENYKFLDINNGVLSDFNSKEIEVEIYPGEIRFFLIGPENSVKLPQMKKSKLSRGYSQHPCMKFLKIKEKKEKKTLKRIKEPDKIYVGIFKGIGKRKEDGYPYEKGSKAIYECLKEKEGLVVEYLPSLSEEIVYLYDVIIIPNMGHPGVPENLNKDWQKVIREFVFSGGGVLVCQHSVGYENFFPPLFPSIATVKTYVPLREMKVIKEHPVITGESILRKFPKKANDPAFAQQLRMTRMQKGDIFYAGFADHDILVPGPSGEVIIRSVYDSSRGIGDDPVVVVGKFGRGKVVACGMTLGYIYYREKGKWVGPIEKLTEGEKKLLINSVYWLGE